MAKLKTKSVNGYPRYDNNIRTTKVPLIGFEWEVPLLLTPPDDDDCDEGDWSYYDHHNFRTDQKFKDYCKSRSLAWHFECGCLEFASPVANTISVARASALDLIKFVENQEGLTTEDVINNQGGIHVSVSAPVGVEYTDRTARNITGMLNRHSSKAFIWKFSGRGEQSYNDEYQCQGQSSCWDRYNDEDDYSDKWDFHDSMFRFQGNRIEYRLWANFPEYLIPAIEFTHSTYIFCKNKSKVPYLKDYKTWLFKQPGYKALKEFAPWNLI